MSLTPTGQRKTESRALSRTASDGHTAAMLVCDHINKGKSEASTPLPGCSRLIDLEKALEQVQWHFGSDALL